MKNINEAILNYIESQENYFRSENIETGKTPTFIVYCSRSNDREKLNLYFDYKTSTKFINRAIFCLCDWDSIESLGSDQYSKAAVLKLKSLGIQAYTSKDSYQSEGMK